MTKSTLANQDPKKREKNEPDGQPALPGVHGGCTVSKQDDSSFPVQLQVDDRFSDETREYEVIGRPYTTNAGKDVHVRVKRVDNAEITMIRSWAAHERIVVRRGDVRRCL